MWDRSYRWQRHVRLAAGGFVIVTLIIAAVILSGTSAAARTGAGARDLARELLSPGEQIIRVDVPASLLPRVGTLVYRHRDDGLARRNGLRSRQRSFAHQRSYVFRQLKHQLE